MSSKVILTGIDVGSTTVKVVAIDAETRQILHRNYLRHNAHPALCLQKILGELQDIFSSEKVRIAVCGSGGAPFAKRLALPFVQEVVANSLAVRQLYPDTRVAIELGGQDAKIIFFEHDLQTGNLVASDMRMNGSCAGGTGAFLDQIAELLNIDVTQFSDLASQGTQVYEISGRCGVFAKTDIQPLLNQGVSRADIALSSLHAVAKQTIGGLAQGMEIHPPVIFEGGPLTFNMMLAEVFRERLGFSGQQAILPENAETLVALGAALSLTNLFGEDEGIIDFQKLSILDKPVRESEENTSMQIPAAKDGLFATDEEKRLFLEAHPIDLGDPPLPADKKEICVWIGIDSGSTTTKFALIDEEGNLVASYYAPNMGDPLRVLRESLCELESRISAQGIQLNVLGVGSTGYGELLVAKALGADHHMVETVAHARAARELVPDVSFILDIGGQDMKAIGIQDGVVNGIILNEACSSGCGSFIETYAQSLGIPVSQVAERAFMSKQPSRLGSRCTVFMNSSIITEQRDGKSPEDIMAGLCLSVIENVFTKVVRFRNLAQMGERVVVQGGTFRNDAVLRAFELFTGIRPHRPKRPGLMGAIGIALLTRDRNNAAAPAPQSQWIGWNELKKLKWDITPGQLCNFCSNNCNRTVVRFANGKVHVTGNRCERGEIIEDRSDPEKIREELARIQSRINAIADILKDQPTLLFRSSGNRRNLRARHLVPSFKGGLRIGIPRVLEFWSSFPFWEAFFTSLGHEVVLSRPSNYKLFERGLKSVPSDTICFPAKLAHGHIMDLADKKVDRIFFPIMMAIPSEHEKEKAIEVCPVVQGYPMVVKEQDNPEEKYGIPLDQPVFHWHTKLMRRNQSIRWFQQNWKLAPIDVSRAVSMGERALNTYWHDLEQRGRDVLKNLKDDDQFAVVIAGRPYHADPLINHAISSHFSAMGIPVLSVESLPGIHKEKLNPLTRIEVTNSYHSRLLSAALIVAQHPKLQLAQIVSFGCGHDAILTDEVARILREKGDKELLVVKLDEGEVKGPLGIRVKSFIETVRTRMLDKAQHKKGTVSIPFPQIFTKDDAKRRTILIPNLNHGFAILAAAVLRNLGYKTQALPIADRLAVELGKRYVHNDICYPAQINIGECLSWLKLHPDYPRDNVAIALAKNCGNCRAGQYSALARRALDEAGYCDIPIVTTGDDTKMMHPGFRPGLGFRFPMVWGIALLDKLETMVRAIRPYEITKGEADAVHQHYLQTVLSMVPVNKNKALRLFAESIDAFNSIKVNRAILKPRVAVLGEILMKYHPGANGYVEDYLERNGMEVIQPGMLDFFRRDELIRLDKVRRGLARHPLSTFLVGGISELVYSHVVKKVDSIFTQFKWQVPHADCYELAKITEGLVDRTYVTGEGWLIPGEILRLSQAGVDSFVIVQPFGCLANHISGRGLTQSLRKRAPHVQILSLDYDPDTSMANVENRLQMLVIQAKARQMAGMGKPLNQTVSPALKNSLDGTA